jgi:hypothetical protein
VVLALGLVLPVQPASAHVPHGSQLAWDVACSFGQQAGTTRGLRGGCIVTLPGDHDNTTTGGTGVRYYFSSAFTTGDSRDSTWLTYTSSPQTSNALDGIQWAGGANHGTYGPVTLTSLTIYESQDGGSTWAAVTPYGMSTSNLVGSGKIDFDSPDTGAPCANPPSTTGCGGAGQVPSYDPLAAGVTPVTAISRPAYECQRTYDPATGTVSVTATGPSGLPAGALTGAVLDEHWSIPWIDDGASTTPKVATLTVPPEAPPGGWTLTFTAILEVTSPNYEFTPTAQDVTAAYLPYLTRLDEWIAGATATAVDGNPVLIGVIRNGTTTLDPRLPHDRYVGTSDDDQPLRMYFDPDTANVYGYWPRLAGEAERSPWVYIGKTTGATYRNAPSGFGGLWRVPVSGAGYSTTTSDTTSVRCQVLLDVDRPTVGGSAGTEDGPGESDPPTTGGGSSCDAGPLGSIPIIGGILDSTANLACIVGGLLGHLLDGLVRLFVPSWTTCGGDKPGPWCGLFDDVEAQFPLNIGAEVVRLVTGLIDSITTAAAAGDPCYTIPVGGLLDAITPDSLGGPVDPDATIRLVTPSSTGCAGMMGRNVTQNADGSVTGTNVHRSTLDNFVGDIGGLLPVVYGIQQVLLVLWFCQSVVRAFSQDDPSALEPT